MKLIVFIFIVVLDLAGVTTHINQYGYTEKIADKNSVSSGVILAGQFVKDFQGIIINYDFSPVLNCLLI